MFHADGKYLKPSKETRVLAILDSLAEDSEISQSELGRRLHLSGAMINQYLKVLQENHLIEYERVNGKSFRYVLTAEGEESRRQMFSDYSSEAVRFYSTVKGFVQQKMQQLAESGVRRIALFGASETCEVVLSAIRGMPFQVLLLLDNAPQRQGTLFNGYVVSPPEALQTVECESVVITSFGKQDEIYRQLKPLSLEKGFTIMRF